MFCQIFSKDLFRPTYMSPIHHVKIEFIWNEMLQHSLGWIVIFLFLQHFITFDLDRMPVCMLDLRKAVFGFASFHLIVFWSVHRGATFSIKVSIKSLLVSSGHLWMKIPRINPKVHSWFSSIPKPFLCLSTVLFW